MRISAAERAAWDPRVVVLFQPKAWVDRNVAVQIAKALCEDEKKISDDDCEKVWLGDNLDAQCTLQYRQAMMEGNMTVLHYPPKTSDKGLAPVDNGAGRAVTQKIGELQEEWLENDENMEAWESNTLTASQRRVLVTKWVGDATCALFEQRDTLKKYFAGAGWPLRSLL